MLKFIIVLVSIFIGKVVLCWIVESILASILMFIGFGPSGPIAGTFAAYWEAWYMGFVPAGGLFAFLESLAMDLA